MNAVGAQKRVFVGLSGGVDSSVAAARLIRAGYEVTGVFIKVWQPPQLPCTWEAERLDAMRVAAALGIPFLTCDAEERYKNDVADYLIREYASGRTPNPDVMCNKHVKFGAFLDFARAHGADYVATGHYAQKGDGSTLLRGVDAAKDQSYFLWTLTTAQLEHTLFPIGDTEKAEVRAEAKRYGLPTAAKPDSQGICFLGALDMKEFLLHFLPREPGMVEDDTGAVIGEHDGVHFYTLGQRHGFRIHRQSTEERPQYIVRKDLKRNVLVVAPERPMASVESSFALAETNWIGDVPEYAEFEIRYHQTPVRARIEKTEDGAIIHPEGPFEMPASGQSCVLYDGERVLGGGIVV